MRRANRGQAGSIASSDTRRGRWHGPDSGCYREQVRPDPAGAGSESGGPQQVICSMEGRREPNELIMIDYGRPRLTRPDALPSAHLTADAVLGAGMKPFTATGPFARVAWPFPRVVLPSYLLRARRAGGADRCPAT